MSNTVSRSQKGLTLIEILVVMFILGLLITLVAPRVMNRTDDARLTKAKHDIRSIESALNLYKLDNFVYPSNDQGLLALVEQPSGTPEARNWKQDGYIERLPTDPWGYEYQYLNPGNMGTIDIFSFGADGKPGGEDINADIGNWNLE
ncbi:MAG TPA: type II secretion system protein GspG [Gammaproteobacteria bacterium]|nr:type II secretion system protein GspG [Gammaproteobacteria bacterium]